MSDTNQSIFQGCIPALMTPCYQNGEINYDALVATAQHLMNKGMRGVVYCGSMGDWPLLSEEQRMKGVELLVKAGIPTVVGTGAQNGRLAVAHAAHARKVGASGLMVIPRVLSRGSSPTAQRHHFSEILKAGGELPAVIYNSPHYGFETKADLFFSLRAEFPSLVGFKEFGGAAALSYAAEHITSEDPSVILMAGVDTQVYHGFVNCGATGAITGVGTALPTEILRYIELCKSAATGNLADRRFALELSEALTVLSKFDEGTDLVLFYKELMVLEGNDAYRYHINSYDQLSPSQRQFLHHQHALFRTWWANWDGK
jgi:dihydrodipicolinate synthase/N-acetylneuraminate lyase